jgi:hypothetical protein
LKFKRGVKAKNRNHCGHPTRDGDCEKIGQEFLSPPVQERGRISIPQILGFSTLGVNVMFNLPSVTSTLTLST